MTEKMSATILTRACNGQLLQDSSLEVTGFSIDTRTIKPGDLFVALKGDNQDGHKYVKAAVKAGAAAVLVSENLDCDALKPAAVIMVSDTLTALQQIAQQRRQGLGAFFIGVTGSNGKTTTRSMINHLLAASKRCSATSGNLNNHIGLPLTLLAIDPDSEFAILEMGMNHPDEIRTLCKIARPHAALISNIGPAHIGILGSLRNIALAKAEILEDLSADQVAVIPGDTEFTDLLKAATRARVCTFGEKPENDYCITNLQMTVDAISFDLTCPSASGHCLLNLAGQHNAFNAAAALTLYHRLGFNLKEGCRLMSSFAPVGARMEKVSINGINLLLDCYNANPGSMVEALKFLAICPPQRVAVLGDMRELGDLSTSLHRQLGEKAAEIMPELLICVGQDASHIAEAAKEKGMSAASVISLSSNDQAAELLKEKLQKGSTVLFKASRGMHFETIVQKLWPDLVKDLH